jgi:hypothetical protein
MPWWGSFLLGLFIGANFGYLVFALLNMARDRCVDHQTDMNHQRESKEPTISNTTINLDDNHTNRGRQSRDLALPH